MLKKFNEDLVKAGCKKLDQLTPIFDKIDTKLLKLNKTVVEDLKEVEKIVFSEDGTAKTPAKEAEKEEKK